MVVSLARAIEKKLAAEAPSLTIQNWNIQKCVASSTVFGRRKSPILIDTNNICVNRGSQFENLIVALTDAGRSPDVAFSQSDCEFVLASRTASVRYF